MPSMKTRRVPPLPRLADRVGPPGIAPERVLEFQHLMERRYGIHLTYEQAAERGAKLVALYRAILGPIPEASPPAHGP